MEYDPPYALARLVISYAARARNAKTGQNPRPPELAKKKAKTIPHPSMPSFSGVHTVLPGGESG